MDRRLQYYKALSKVFETPGWKYFIEDVQQQIDNVQKSYNGIKDIRELGVLQGREGAFAEILMLEDGVRAHMYELEEELKANNYDDV